MNEQERQILEVLQFNKGFSNPEKWIDYALSHKFQKVKAVQLDMCPDCGNQVFNLIGQFVYYSSLVRLQKCNQCNVIFSNIRIDPVIIQKHFELGYKDEKYFLESRSRIFKQITSLASNQARQKGNVLDIGGAKGHLLSMLQKSRSDLNYILNDLSEDACDFARKKYGFSTIVGGIDSIAKVNSKFDIVILSDVIYYESEINKLWETLSSLVTEKGTVMIRVPNKLPIILLWQFLKFSFSSKDKKSAQDKVKFLNPEHLFIFSNKYLKNRLKSIGFEQVRVIPSELLLTSKKKYYIPFYYYLSILVRYLTFGKIIITPSLLVVAVKK